MQQIIINTPINSGLGDSLYSAFTKTNLNFTELYTNVATISASTLITKTSQLVNDGDDTVNPFISLNDLPTSKPISYITGLQTELDNIHSELTIATNTNTTQSTDILNLQNQIVALNNTIVSLTNIINTQNANIAAIQADITNIYSIIL